jgi:hypothetical protein
MFDLPHLKNHHHRPTQQKNSPDSTITLRNTYWLQLPYSYAVPLMLISVATHWLLSQAFFLLSVPYVENYGGVFASYISRGFSAMAIISGIVLRALILISIVISAFQRYPKRIKFACCSSVAISATCHPLPDENDVTAPVRWRVVHRSEDGIERRSFRSRELISIYLFPSH